MVFANLAYNQSNLAHIKQQARSVAGKVNNTWLCKMSKLSGIAIIVLSTIQKNVSIFLIFYQ